MVTEDKETGARRLSLLAAFVASEAYSIYATFFAHALTPVTVYVVDRYTHRRLLPGQIGDIEEVFTWDGLVPILVFSLIVFSLTWCIMRVTARCAHRSGSRQSPNLRKSTHIRLRERSRATEQQLHNWKNEHSARWV